MHADPVGCHATHSFLRQTPRKSGYCVRMASEAPLAVLSTPRVPLSALASARIRTVQHDVAGIGSITILIQDMGKSVFVWCSSESREMSEAVIGSPVPESVKATGSAGASSVLFQSDSESTDDAASFAARLGSKLNKLVLLSWNVDRRYEIAQNEIHARILRECSTACT